MALNLQRLLLCLLSTPKKKTKNEEPSKQQLKCVAITRKTKIKTPTEYSFKDREKQKRC